MSCWNTQLFPRFNFLAADLRRGLRPPSSSSLFCLPFTLCNVPVTLAEKLPQSILPLTLHQKSHLYSSSLCPNRSIFIFSDHNAFLRLSNWSLILPCCGTISVQSHIKRTSLWTVKLVFKQFQISGKPRWFLDILTNFLILRATVLFGVLFQNLA